MANDIFRRVEKKYLLSKEEYDSLMDKIWFFIKEDTYFKSSISNIYYDNSYNELIINSIDKPVFKEKVRVRSYKTPKSDKDEVFLEIKRKFKGVVGKRRVKITLKEFYDFIEKRKYKDSQIFRELHYIFDFYKLEPMMFVGYDRLSYRGKDDENLRITFDSNLRSREVDLRLELGDYGEKFFDDDIYIMEIKTLGAMPLWLVEALSELKIYPSSFSKIGKIYCKKLEVEDVK
jgi:SPX domain protein involved in polyphosphate accumulation